MKTLCVMTSVHPHDDVRVFHLEAIPLAAAGWRVVILNREFAGKKEGVWFEKVPLPPKRLERMAQAASRFLAAARSIPADLYLLHDPELLPAGRRLAGEGKRVIYDAHEDLPPQLLGKEWIPAPLRPGLSRLARGGEKKLTSRFVCCLGATPEIAARFPQGEVFRNLPLPEQFPPGPDLSLRSRQAVYLGSITRSRGLFSMLRGVADTGIPLVLAGRMENEELLKKAREHPGWNKVEWLGQQERKTLPHLLAQCRMGLLLLDSTDAYRRSMPIKLFEYCMAGVPVIASDFPFWRQLTGGRGCLFVPPDDPACVSQAMTRLSQDDQLACRLGREAREMALERFNGRWEQRRLLELMARLAEQPPPGGKEG